MKQSVVYAGIITMKIDYKEVGKRIRKYRERLDLTQEDLAFAIKTSTAFVSEIERAVKKPSLDKLADIAEILGVTVNDFIYPDGVHIDNITGIEAGFLKRLSKYSREEQDRLLDSLDSLANIVSSL